MTRPQLATKKMSLPVHGGNDPSVGGGHTEHARARLIKMERSYGCLFKENIWCHREFFLIRFLLYARNFS